MMVNRTYALGRSVALGGGGVGVLVQSHLIQILTRGQAFCMVSSDGVGGSLGWDLRKGI